MRQLGWLAAVFVAGVALGSDVAGKLDLGAVWEAQEGSPPSWMALEGSCTLSGQLKSRYAGPGTTIAFLPPQCKPARSVQFTAKGHEASMKVDVATSGEMVMATGTAATWVSLDGVTFSLSR